MFRFIPSVLVLLCAMQLFGQHREGSIVLLRNEGLLPLKHLDSLTIEYSGNTVLANFGKRYTENQGVTSIVIESVRGFDKPTLRGEILLIFGDSATITSEDLRSYKAVVYAAHNDSATLDLITQKLFGGRAFHAVLGKDLYGFKAGDGLVTPGGLRFAFGHPLEVALDSEYLNSKIDSIALIAIDSGVAPGIQVLVARHGVVVFHKTYGYQTYDSVIAVDKDMLYDFASVTKITGALPGLMQLYDANKFSLDATMGTYLSYFARGNKKDLQYRRVLSHNARLQAWIPYWTTTLKKNGKYRSKSLAIDSTARYSVKLTDSLFLHNEYRDKIYKMIRKSPLLDEEKYVYSGLSFYLYPEIIEKLSGEAYEAYLKKHIYQPLGASTLTFNPLRYYPKDRMIPTEIDTFFRKTPLVGVVHDEGAAMMRGLSSNAGLFGSTLDLAKLMQMYLWRGAYGGEQYIAPQTVELFTSCHYCNEGNRRGLAFDKPVLTDKANGSTAIDASPHSFGHSGYTGTFTWADPDTGILFLFMSNRVYPTRNNSKIYQLNIRPAMHQAIYDARIDKTPGSGIMAGQK